MIEETALVAALREKRIAGAMLDMSTSTIASSRAPALSLDNAVLTPTSRA